MSLHQAFTSKSVEDTSSLYFAYSFHPGSVSLEQRCGMKGGARYSPISCRIIDGPHNPSEASIWSIICQIVCALRHLHLQNLACRVLSPSKILVQGRNRVRISCVGILDVISPATQEFAQLCQATRYNSQSTSSFEILGDAGGSDCARQAGPTAVRQEPCCGSAREPPPQHGNTRTALLS